MLIKKPDDIKSSEITPEQLYYDRRDFLKAAGLLGIATPAVSTGAISAWSALPGRHYDFRHIAA